MLALLPLSGTEISFLGVLAHGLKEEDEISLLAAMLAFLNMSVSNFWKQSTEVIFHCMYLKTTWELFPWMFSLDSHNHEGCPSVHNRDIYVLPIKHPLVYAEFHCGSSVVLHRTKRLFLSIILDHEVRVRVRYCLSHRGPRCLEKMDGCYFRPCTNGWRIQGGSFN